MFIGKQVIKKVGRLKKPIIILCAFALFILPITNILLAHPALATKDPSKFSNLKESDQYKFFTYASAMARCFSYKSLAVHTDVDDQMLHDNVVFRTWGGVYTYIGTYPEVKGFDKGGIKCNGTEFQQEAFNTFGISPNELLCYMGYPKNGLEGKNDSNTKHEKCVALGSTNDFTYSNMPENGEENFLNALTALTGYDRNVAEKNAYIKYRKYSDWIKGCVDGEATSKSDNTWTVSVVNKDTGKVDTIYKPKGKGEYLYGGGDEKYGSPYKDRSTFSCLSIQNKLKTAARDYSNAIQKNAADTACAGLAGKELAACKAGIEHKNEGAAYCKTYTDEKEREACEKGQNAKIETAAEEEEGGEPKNSCGIDGGLGWLICPVMTFVANINDAAYGAISGFLDIKPAILGDNSNTSGAKQGWDFFRNIANAIFAVIFLWIIFSQISNVGVSNYGIKKILPRLIIGALLVNLSYYLCRIFVDLSNILGHTLKDALESGVGGIGTGSEAAGWGSAIAATIVGVGGVVAFAALAVGIPTLVAGFFAIMTVFIILVVRQAGIILLVAISPVAFAAWLLPNTEDLFKKWMKMLRGLLLVFPIISLLYGAGKLAGAILISSATVDPNNPDETMQLVALAATTMPLIATPFVLQNSLSSLGSIGAKIGRMSAGAHSRLAGNVKSTAKGRVDNSVIGDTKRKYLDFMDRKRASMRASDRRAKIDNSKFGRFMGWDKGGARARATVNKAFESDVENASTMLQGMTSDKIADMANGTTVASKAMRAAAIDHTMANGSFKERMDVLSSLKDTDNSIKQRAIKAAYAKKDNNIIGNGFGDAILNDEVGNMQDLSNMAVNNAASGNLQAEHLVQNGAATKWLSDAITNSGNQQAKDAFRKAGEVAISNPNTAKNINQAISEAFSAHGVLRDRVALSSEALRAMDSSSQQSPQNNQQGNSSSGGIIIPSNEDVNKYGK